MSDSSKTRRRWTILSSARPQLRSFVAAGGLMMVLGGLPAHGQTASEEAYQAYVSGLQALGFDTSNNGVRYDAQNDQLIVSDETLVFAGAVDFSEPGNDNGRLGYELTFSAGTTTIDGLRLNDGRFSAEAWRYSDDAKMVLTGDVEGEGRGMMEARFIGTEISNYSFVIPVIPEADPRRPASRWLPFLRAATRTSYDEARIGASAVTFEAYALQDGLETLMVSGTVQFDGYRFEDARDGRIAMVSLDRMVQSVLARDDHAGEMRLQTTQQGEAVYKNLNGAAFLDLFDPGVPVTGERIPVVGSQVIRSYESSQDLGNGMTLRLTAGESSAEDLFVVKRDYDFLGLLDSLLRGDEPQPDELIIAGLQLYRSLGAGDARVNDLLVSLPDPDAPDKTIRVSVSEISVSDVSSEGIGAVQIAGVSAPTLPGGGSIKLDRAGFSGITFADFPPMRDMITALIDDPDQASEDPLAIARVFAPYALSAEISGLDVSVPDEGRVALDGYMLDLGTAVPPIPTRILSKTDRLVLPVDAADDPDIEALLEGLGLNEIVWSDETRFFWDESTLDLTLERLMISVEGLGTVEASFRFSNVPKALFEDPEGQGQIALATAKFVDAEFRYIDSGLARNGLAFAANDAGVPESVMSAALAEQAAEAVGFFNNPAFSAMVRDAATSFLDNPNTLTVSVRPVNSVPLTQILGSLAAPQVIPDLLNIQVGAD
ncbi:MAG: hypothetical protein JJ902_00115 [Roseibium sp.]|nr:hypothetical protein [Roseibium sp.]